MRAGIFSVESLESRTLFSGGLCLPAATPPKPGVSKGIVPSAPSPLGIYFGTYMRTNSALAEPEYGTFKLTVNKTRGGDLFATMEISSQTEGLITRTAPLVLKTDGKFQVFFFSPRLVMRMEGQFNLESGVISSKFQGLKRSDNFRADVNLSRSQSIVNGN
jgi:hypothetical protein